MKRIYFYFIVFVFVQVSTGIFATELPPNVYRYTWLSDIAPILDKKGCSSALCHGKFGGKGGLDLSLLTLNPEADHNPIVFGNRGRRINLIEPERSLFLLKPTEQVSHEGGLRFEVNSEDYLTILSWIENGAKFSADEPRLQKLEIEPKTFTLDQMYLDTFGADQNQIKVIAHFADGTIRDVTEKSVFESKDEPIVEVDENGIVTAKRWGGTAIVARFLGVVQASFVTIPREGKIDPTKNLPQHNVIDQLVSAKLQKLNITPSEICDDHTFIRRIFLDTAGRLPTRSEIENFIADDSENKRSILIDQLLDSKEFVDLQTLRFSDLLRSHPRQLGQGSFGQRGATLYHEWIRDNISANTPYDKFIEMLITARGSTYQIGQTNFYRIDRSADSRAEAIAQVFLGIRLGCARCHKHPFDRWTTDDYWDFSAFGGKVGSRQGELYQELVVFYNPTGRVINQSVEGNRGQTATPKFLGGDAVDQSFQGDYVQLLSDWITSPTNPYFGRAIANRIWNYYFGRGVMNPVDDMTETSPETIEGLLDALADELIKSDFDLKVLTRLILNSATYQLSAAPNETNKLDDRFFSHFYPRAMPAQVLLDVINDVTRSKDRFGRYPAGTRAVELPLPVSSRFMDLFGRSNREFLADLDPKLEPNLTQALHMINSRYINNKVSKKNGTIMKLIRSKKNNAEIIEEIYLMTLSRKPTRSEIQTAKDHIVESRNRREGFEDLMWAIITSRAFLFNS